MYRIGIDVGGTFTDLVAADAEGRVTMAKAASTPEDQSLGVMEGLTLIAREQGQALHDAERLVLGRGGGLGHGDASLCVRRDEVGEGPAHVYPDAIHG